MDDLPPSEPRAAPGDPPAVTIVMSFRERWSLTEQSIEAVVASTPRPYRFVLLDTGMPRSLFERLRERSAAWGLEVVDSTREGQWPTHARAAFAPRIDTPFVVFIDNDVMPMPGWLEALLSCARATGAGIVGPLYLWGEHAASDLIHMAGGALTIENDGERRVMKERHRLINRRLGEVESGLKREVCGFVEYHCMLMRAEVMRLPDVFDPEIVSAHEHIHASLLARRHGWETWVEPAARVNYLARSPWRLGEVAMLRRRWSPQALERSLRRFSALWNVLDDERSFGSVRAFVVAHGEAVDPLRSGGADPSVARSAMVRGDLEQAPGGLLMQARRAGYGDDEIRRIAKACILAMRLSEGIYRPCGRPFISHLVGTASVLVHYGFNLRMVLVGLLHAAFTHSLRGGVPAGPMHDNVVALLGGPDSEVMRGVGAYAGRGARYRALRQAAPSLAALGVGDAELLLLEAANDIDMHLSGEVAFTGRADVPRGSLLVLIARTCEALGLPGMAATLRDTRREPQQPAGIAFHPEPGSFVFTAGGTRSAVARAPGPGAVSAQPNGAAAGAPGEPAATTRQVASPQTGSTRTSSTQARSSKTRSSTRSSSSA